MAEKNALATLSSLFAEIDDITQELFPGEVSLHLLYDPGYPGYRYTVIEAEATGSAEDVIERQLEWHRRVEQLDESYSELSITFNYRR